MVRPEGGGKGRAVGESVRQRKAQHTPRGGAGTWLRIEEDAVWSTPSEEVAFVPLSPKHTLQLKNNNCA